MKLLKSYAELNDAIKLLSYSESINVLFA
jgi:hypothetical protein